ncbi:MAG: RNA 2'-phosphotransferase [Candidatus Thorarchaeota archaeon]
MSTNTDFDDINHQKNLSRLSKYLSLILRHKPEVVEASINDNGWLNLSVEQLAQKISADSEKSFSWVTSKDIEEVVKTDPKGRYEIATDNKSIRATYGHSIKAEGLLDSISPIEELPEILYFGCSNSEINNLLRLGINNSDRKYIHLSSRKNDALAIARKKFRRDARVVSINLIDLAQSGVKCKKITELVFIVESVPPQFVKEIPVPERYQFRSHSRSNYNNHRNYRRTSGHPSTFQPRNEQGNSERRREYNRSYKKKKPMVNKKQLEKDTNDSDLFDDFDDEIEFVTGKPTKKSKKGKMSSFDDVEITDEDFDFEL